MKSRQCGLILGSLACFVVINNHVKAGPASRRLAREIYPELEQENDANQSQVCVVGDVVYGVDEMVPAEQPCLKCRCQPPGVLCEATRCGTKKHGCKAVHRPNQCCPNYQCECEYNNKKYSNGERLEALPGDECKVCYCRGGEIQCTDVSCYVRNDCEGKQVQGQCCPKYDHCPTRDYLEKLASGSTNASSAFNFIGEEIIATPPKEQVMSHDSNKSQSQNNKVFETLDPLPQRNSMLIPRISIQEVIPDSKDISTPDPHVKLEPINGEMITENNTSERTQNNEENTNDLTAIDSDAESSEIEEVIHNPPPVIRIGDNLLFLRKNELINEKDASSTPTSIITLIGAEGLQRGGVEEVVENITNIGDFDNTYPMDTAEDDINDLSSASSSHILSLVKKKKKPTTSVQSTTIVPSSITNTTSVNISTSNTTQSSSLPLFSAEESTFSQDEISGSPRSPEIIYQNNSQESSNTSYSSTPVDQTGNIYLDIEQNPAYPTIPDIITRYTDEGWIRVDTIGNINQSSSTEKINFKESRILPGILEIRNNATLPVNVTHIEWLKSNYNNGSTQANFANISSTSSKPVYESTEKEVGIEIEDQTTTPITDSSTSVEWEEILTSTEPQLNPQLQVITDVEEMDGSEKNVTHVITSKENLRSVEAIENSGEYSGEKTTPKESNIATITSMEDASIEGDKKETEVNDMLFVKEYTIDLVNDEERKELDQVNNSTNSPDVEIINVSELEKTYTSSEIPEKLPKPEKVVLTDKTINKRENTPQDVDDAVFAELQQELGLGSTEKPKTSEEEEIEAKKIFQELLEETSSPKSQKTADVRTKDSESLEKISQALTKLALKNSQPLDVGVLSVLKDFFASQYRAYESKSP